MWTTIFNMKLYYHSCNILLLILLLTVIYFNYSLIEEYPSLVIGGCHMDFLWTAPTPLPPTACLPVSLSQFTAPALTEMLTGKPFYACMFHIPSPILHPPPLFQISAFQPKCNCLGSKGFCWFSPKCLNFPESKLWNQILLGFVNQDNHLLLPRLKTLESSPGSTRQA